MRDFVYGPLYYASLGFDILTYKTVRSRPKACCQWPNLVPMESNRLDAPGATLLAGAEMAGSWAVSFGMPSRATESWRADVEATRKALPAGDAAASWRGGEWPDVGLAGVGAAPGVSFGQMGKRAVRLSYASSEDNIREAARRLGEYLGRR